MVDKKQLLIFLLAIMGSMITASSSFAQDDDLMQDEDPAQVEEGAMEGGINFFIDLAQNQKIEGVAVDIQKLKVTTGFGDAEVPLDKIDAIRLNAMDDGTAVLAFKNGDILTGVLHLNDLKIKTGWGFGTINLAYIDQISVTKGATFSSSTSPNGKRTWAFRPGR